MVERNWAHVPTGSTPGKDVAARRAPYWVISRIIIRIIVLSMLTINTTINIVTTTSNKTN